jgi:large subunit ribosomal protein L32e
VKIGYKNVADARHLHPSGLPEVIVYRPRELEGIDPKGRVIRIAHTVGEKKRVAILERAKELGLRILNPGKPAAAPAAEEFVLEEPKQEGEKQAGKDEEE